MADPQPIDAPPGVDPSVVAAMQGGFAAPGPQMQQRMYDAPAPMQDSYMLPEPVAQAVQSQFAQPPQPLPPPQAPPDVPVGVIDNGKFIASPPPGFVPQPLVNPFPEPTAADKKAADAAVKAQALAAKADAQKQAKAAAYAATPQGMDEASVRQQLAVNKDQQTNALAMGDVDSKAAAEASGIEDQGVADEQAVLAKQAAQKQADLAQLRTMVETNGKAVEEAAKRTVDPNRMWNNMSTAQHIGLGIMSVLAGIGMGLTHDNGVNPVTKMISDAIDKDVDSQKGSIDQGNKAIEQRRQLAQDFGALSDKQSDQYEYMRAKGRLMVADQLEAAAAHYKSPKALIAAKIAADGYRAEAAKIVGALSERKQAQQNKDAELANTRTGLGIQGGQLALARDEFQEKKTEYGDTLADKVMARHELADEKLQLAQIKKGKAGAGELMVPTGQMVKNPDGSVIAHHEKLINEDGQPFELPGGPAEQAKVYERFTSYTQYIKDLTELRELYDQNAGQLNKWDATARAKRQSLTRSIVDAHQAYGISGFKGPVVEMMNKAITGSDDEDSVNAIAKNIAPQLKSELRHAVEGRRAILGANFTGDPKQLDVPDPLENKPPESGESKLMKTFETPAQKMPAGLPSEVIRAAQQDPSGYAAQQVAKANGTNLSDEQTAAIRVMAHSLNSPTTRESTAKMLDKIVADPAATAASKQAAQTLLDTLGRPKVTVDPE